MMPLKETNTFMHKKVNPLKYMSNETPISIQEMELVNLKETQYMRNLTTAVDVLPS